MRSFSRPLLAVALASSSLWALPAHAVGRLVDVHIVDRASGQQLPVYEHRGEYWVAGQPHAGYAIEVRSQSGRRVLAVMSVDGVNVITGQTASTHQDGYVLSPWQQARISGWRKNLDEVATFYFTTPGKSYASRTGRPHDVGVIGVAVFEEKPVPPIYRPPIPLPRPVPYGKSMESGRAESADAAAAAGAPQSMPPMRDEEPGQALGTGHGEREDSHVSTTQFVRASTTPAEIIRIRYDSHANLRARGIIDTPAMPHVRPPRAFPKDNTGFVPDPPR